MPDTYNSQDYVAPLDKLRAILGGRPMPGAVAPPPQDAPVNPASLSAAQSVYGRSAPALPIKAGVTNLQPSASVSSAPPEMAAPDMTKAISAPPDGSFEDQYRAQAGKQQIPWRNALLNAPAPPFNTPEREAATKTLGTPPPTYEANKPRWWERVLGGLSAGAMAYGRVPGAVEAGSNVTNRRSNRAENEYQNSQANARNVLGEQDKAYGAQEKTWYNSLTQGNRDEMNNIRQQNADTLAQKEKDLNATREESNSIRRDKLAPGPGKYQNNKAAVADMKANGVRLTGDEEKYFLVNGKLREPNPEAEARLAEARASRADRETNADANRSDREDARYNRSLQTYNAKKADIAQREQVAFNQLENRARDKSGALTDPSTLESRKKELQKQFEAEYNQLGPEPKAGTPRGNKFSAQAKPESGNTKVLDPSNPDHLAIAKSYLSKAGGDKDKARKLAKADGYSF